MSQSLMPVCAMCPTVSSAFIKKNNPFGKCAYELGSFFFHQA